MHFLDFLFPPRQDELALRTLPADGFLPLLHPIEVPGTEPATVWLLPFSEASVRSAVHEAKYRGTSRAKSLLSAVLVEYLRGETWLGTAVIVPIPLSGKRRRERGFSETEEVARLAGKELGLLSEPSLLERVRDTKSQVSLSGLERRENMRGAFRAAQPVDPDRIYLLLDDVITTGATMQAAIDALRAAGARHISPIALAH